MVDLLCSVRYLNLCFREWFSVLYRPTTSSVLLYEAVSRSEFTVKIISVLEFIFYFIRLVTSLRKF